MKAVEVKNLSIKYDKNIVLEDVSLNIEDKHFLGIIGPNGGGKTTFLKVLAGLIKVKKGIVKVYGKKPVNNKGIVGYVPQISNFNKSFPINVRNVIISGSLPAEVKFFQKYKKEDYKKTNKIMKKLNLYHLRNRQIGQLSGGQLQKVLIGRALMTNPKLLLLDEPTASIDATTTSQIYEILNDLNQNMTVIVVTHDLEVVSSYFDSIACLNKKLYHHKENNMDPKVVKEVYGCPVDLIAHGLPHRVLAKHGGENNV